MTQPHRDPAQPTDVSLAAALRRQLATAADRPVVGTFVKLPTLDTIDVLAAAGFDFVVVDTEHSGIDERTGYELVRGAAARGLAALVRLAATDADRVNRYLEQGAVGVQISTLTSARDARTTLDATRYPPHGTRSMSLAQPAAGFGAWSLITQLEREAAAPPVVVGQIETATTADPLDAILAHLDVAFLGTTDLSVDLGVPGQLDHPTVTARIAEIATAATATNTVLGAFANTPADLPALTDTGVGYVVVGSDVAFLGATARQTAAAARTALTTLRRTQ